MLNGNTEYGKSSIQLARVRFTLIYINTVPYDTQYLLLIVQSPRCENQIDELCREIEKTINHNIQNTLNTLEKDGDAIVDRIDHRISADR